jgi:Inner membrane protein YgaP-like, transmembrane domain
MTIERTLRGIAGFFILLSLGLLFGLEGYDFSSPTWLWFTAFIGLNLLQSAFTNWCPMISMLKALGMKSEGAAAQG